MRRRSGAFRAASELGPGVGLGGSERELSEDDLEPGGVDESILDARGVRVLNCFPCQTSPRGL